MTNTEKIIKTIEKLNMNQYKNNNLDLVMIPKSWKIRMLHEQEQKRQTILMQKLI